MKFGICHSIMNDGLNMDKKVSMAISEAIYTLLQNCRKDGYDEFDYSTLDVKAKEVDEVDALLFYCRVDANLHRPTKEDMVQIEEELDRMFTMGGGSNG